jgi:hypothetical protein
VNLGTVDALARASLHTRRHGEHLRVVNASRELQELVDLVGLDCVLLGRDRRQPEEREEPLRVEECSEADDPTV